MKMLAAVVLAAGLALPGGVWAQSFQRSVEEEGQGRLQEALSTLERVPGPQGEGYVAQLRRGWLLYRLGKNTEAIEAYTRATGLAPRAVEPRIGMLLPLLADRRWASVQKTARDALRLEPGNYLATLRLAYATYQLAQYGEAEGLYRRLSELYPSDVDVRAGLGWALLKLGKPAEAAAQFREVLGLSSKHALSVEGLRAAGYGS